MYFCTRMLFKCQIHTYATTQRVWSSSFEEGKATCRLKQLLSQYDVLLQALVSDTQECLVQPRKGCNQCFPRLRWLCISTSSILHLLDTGQYSPSSHFSWASLPDFIRPTEEAETPNSPGVNSSYMWGMAFSWKLAMSATLNQLNWFVFLIFICQQTNIKDIAIC